MDNLYSITKFPVEEKKCTWLVYRDDQIVGTAKKKSAAEYFVQQIAETVQQEHNSKEVNILSSVCRKVTVRGNWWNTVTTVRAEPVYALSKPVKKRAASFSVIQQDERSRRPITRVPTPCPSPQTARIALHLKTD